MRRAWRVLNRLADATAGRAMLWVTARWWRLLLLGVFDVALIALAVWR
jgi:hypothetical protein